MLEGWSVLENCSMQTTFHVILYRHLYHTTVLYTEEKETVQDEKSLVNFVSSLWYVKWKISIQMSHLDYSQSCRLGGQTICLAVCGLQYSML